MLVTTSGCVVESPGAMLLNVTSALAGDGPITTVPVMKAFDPTLPIIVTDARYSDETLARDEVAGIGADAFLPLPFDRATFELKAAEAIVRAAKHRAPR